MPYIGIQLVTIPEFQAVGTQVGKLFSAALIGQTTVDQALTAAQSTTEREMKRAGYPKVTPRPLWERGLLAKAVVSRSRLSLFAGKPDRRTARSYSCSSLACSLNRFYRHEYFNCQSSHGHPPTGA